VPHLLPLLKDAKTEIRERAAYVLRCVGPLSATAVPSLLAAARENSPAVRFEAIWALREVTPATRGLAVELASLIDGDRPEELEGLISAIWKHDDDYDFDPHLTELLTHQKPQTRAKAAMLYGMTATMQRKEVSKLLAMLDDSDVECRAAAAEALHGLARSDGAGDREVAVEEVVDRLVRAFKNEPDLKVRRAIADTVEWLHRRTNNK
jgi:HEAT repeat protein